MVPRGTPEHLWATATFIAKRQRQRVFDCVQHYLKLDPELVVIEGEASGADTIAREVAFELGIPEDRVLRFPARWDDYPREQRKRAGHDRNTQMLREGKPDLVVAFHVDLMRSRGTINMVRQARAAGVEVLVCSR